MNYYNENDPKTAAWLRELIAANLIPDGHVDERSIINVKADDLSGFVQCHFFAGIGGWPYALRLAGWPDDEPVWTGSCPCQPFSVVGRGCGVEDSRHLWPVFREIVRKRGPAIVFGEQVESKAGRAWLSDVLLDLEAMGFGVGSGDLCAAGLTNHRRQRLYWFASNPASQRVPRLEPSVCSGEMRPWGARCQEDLQLVANCPFLPGPYWPQPLLRATDDGISERVAGCLGAGNAIVPQLAAEFIKAAVEAISECRK